jgi:hypothetical protein
MNEHLRLLQRIFWLLQDCGMPDKIPERDLFYDLYWMMEEHFELFEVDVE